MQAAANATRHHVHESDGSRCGARSGCEGRTCPAQRNSTGHMAPDGPTWLPLDQERPGFMHVLSVVLVQLLLLPGLGRAHACPTAVTCADP